VRSWIPTSSSLLASVAMSFGAQSLGFGAAAGYGASQNNPFASQAQTQSPEKRGRQEDKQTCMPATIRLLLDAQRTVEDKGAELQIHGAEVANVTLVGVVEGLIRQATMLEFTLNDGSGRVKVRHYQNSENSAKEDGLVAGRYARVVGSLRSSPTVHVSAMSLRAITSADEVSFHMIEVAHAALMMKRGGSQAPPPSTAAQQPMSAPAATPTTTLAAPVASPAAAPAEDLRTTVLKVLQNEGESRPEGVPLAIILERVKSSPAGEVRAVLNQLVTDGEAFTTIDDDHFSPI